MNNFTVNPYLYWHNKMMQNYAIYQNNKNNKPRQINISGEWDTNWGKMILEQIDNKVTGTYEWDNGKIEGTLEGYILKGFWSQDVTHDCPNDKGPIEFTFSSDVKSFTGVYAYCDGKVAGGWTGTLINKTPALNVVGTWTVGSGKIVLEQQNELIKGRYEGLGLEGGFQGDIFGNLQGNILTGAWYENPNLYSTGGSGPIRIIFSTDGKELSASYYDHKGLSNNLKGVRMD
jgi:hypothetical protein